MDEEQQTHSLDTKPCFILGEDICDLKQPQQSVQISDPKMKSPNTDSNQLISEQVVRLLFQHIIIYFLLPLSIFDLFKGIFIEINNYFYYSQFYNTYFCILKY